MPAKNKTPIFFHIKKVSANFRVYDRLTLGYLWLTLLLVTFSAKPLSIKTRFLIHHVTATLFIVFLVYFTQAESQFHRHRRTARGLLFLRDWHPLLMFSLFLFGEFTHLANLCFPYWIEHYLLRFDFWLFGQPPHQFIAHYIPPWGIELMAFAYWSYYPLIVGVTALHYSAVVFSVPRQDGKTLRFYQSSPSFNDFMNRLCLVFYTCYILFMLLPARSPRHALGFGNNIPFSGGIFFELVSLIQNYGSVVGAAFPSSHVAVAWIAVLALRQNYRYLSWSLVPLLVTLTVAVVILQYHYVSDAIGGILIAIFVERFRKQLAVWNSEENAAEMLHFSMSETAQAPVT